jgi:SAM-dependent methyltransferase
MHLLVSLIRVVARMFNHLGSRFIQVSLFLNGILPVLLPPKEISAFVQTHYHRIYERDSEDERSVPLAPELSSLEHQLFHRHGVRSGRMLILGSGSGREAIALANRGLTVIGVDCNPVAVLSAHRSATLNQATAYFHVGNFLELPYAPGSFDFAYQSSSMYSSIPSSRLRQDWLRELGRVLKPGGIAMLDFMGDPPSVSRLTRLSRRLNRLLSHVPGTNPAYQPGDEWPAGHFLHSFRNEEELRREVIEAGARIRELLWVRGIITLEFPSSHPGRTVS